MPVLVREWVLKGSIEVEPRAIEEQEGGLGYFVLATEHLDQEKVSDLEILEWHKEEEQVEGSFSWLKGPAALAPIFLKKSQRQDALGLVFLLALMVYTLIERQLRRQLVQREEKIPGNNKLPTQRPTTAVVFKHFEGIRRVCREKVFTLSAKIFTAPKGRKCAS